MPRLEFWPDMPSERTFKIALAPRMGVDENELAEPVILIVLLEPAGLRNLTAPVVPDKVPDKNIIAFDATVCVPESEPRNPKFEEILTVDVMLAPGQAADTTVPVFVSPRM